jgi:hypothetical protein
MSDDLSRPLPLSTTHARPADGTTVEGKGGLARRRRGPDDSTVIYLSCRLVETGYACVGIGVVDQDNGVVVAVEDRRSDPGAVAGSTVDPNLPGRDLFKTFSGFT